jgi:hypothetical protein
MSNEMISGQAVATAEFRMTASAHHSDANTIFGSATSIAGGSSTAVIGLRLTTRGRASGLIPMISISIISTANTIWSTSRTLVSSSCWLSNNSLEHPQRTRAGRVPALFFFLANCFQNQRRKKT